MCAIKAGSATDCATGAIDEIDMKFNTFQGVAFEIGTFQVISAGALATHTHTQSRDGARGDAGTSGQAGGTAGQATQRTRAPTCDVPAEGEDASGAASSARACNK